MEMKKHVSVRLPPRILELVEGMSKKYCETKTGIIEKAITIGLIHLIDLYENSFFENK